jgi:hypothetical protein
MRKSLSLRSGSALVALSAVLVLTLRASAAPADPVAWGESSGYNTIESSRAASSSLIVAAPEFGETSGYNTVEASRAAASALISAPEDTTADGLDSVEAKRVVAAEAALASGDIGSMQEEALTQLVVEAEADSAAAPAEDLITPSGRIR